MVCHIQISYCLCAIVCFLISFKSPPIGTYFIKGNRHTIVESAHLVSGVCFLENQSFTTPLHSNFYMAKLYNIFGLFLTYPVYTLKDIVSSPALAEWFVPSVRPHHPYASDWNMKSNVSSPLRSQACDIIKLRVLPRFTVSGTCFFHGAGLYPTRM